MALVSVACKLPHGLILEVEGKPPVQIKGALHRDAIAGFGITKVDKEFFEQWAKQYAEFKPLKDGLIFAQDREDSARREAEEKKDEKTGFEGLDPSAPAPGIKADNYDGMPKTAE